MGANRETPNAQGQVPLHRVGGLTIQEWGGVDLENAPHLIAETDFQMLINVRRRGAFLIPRPAFQYVSSPSATDTWYIWGICSPTPFNSSMGGFAFVDGGPYDIYGDGSSYDATVFLQLVTTEDSTRTTGQIWADDDGLWGAGTPGDWVEVPKNNETDWVYRTGGASGSQARPMFVYTNRFRVLMTGQWQAPIVIDKRVPAGTGLTQGAYLAGVTADSVGTAAISASGTGITGTVDSAYITWAEIDANGVILSESNPVAVSGTPLTLTNEAISWANLPTSHSNSKVTHKRLWRAMDGGLPRLVTSVTLATTTYADSVATATLNEKEALPNDGSNIVFKRDVPPNARFIVSYHGRTWWAGDEAAPARIYFSDIVDYPSNLSGWEGISGYRDTLEYEAVTGLCVRGDQLLVFCKDCTYEIQGWAAGNEGVAADITIRKIHPTVGAIAQHLVMNVNGRVWLWHDSGPWIYDGAWHYIGKKIRQYWLPATDSPQAVTGDAYALPYRKGFLVHDPVHRTVSLFPDTTRQTGNPISYVAFYGDPDRIRQPDWSFDVYGYDISAGAHMRAGASVSYPQMTDVYLAMEIPSASHVLTKAIYTTTISDAVSVTESTNAQITIATRHEMPRGPGGGIDEGAKFKRLWSYIRNPYEASIETGAVYVYPGDESTYEEANDATAAQDYKTIQDDQTGQSHNYFRRFSDLPNDQYTAYHPSKAVYTDLLDATGRGVTLEYVFTVVNPAFRFYGYTLWVLPGKAYSAPLYSDSGGV